MSTITITQTKMLQDLLAIQKVYYAEFETLDISRDASGEFHLITTEPAQVDDLKAEFGTYPVPLGNNFEEAKTNLLEFISD